MYRTCCHLGSGWVREEEEVAPLVLLCAENTLENRETDVSGCVLQKESLARARVGRETFS